MDKKHVHIICDNLNLLISRTNKLDDIIDKLMERGILNIYMVNHLRVSLIYVFLISLQIPCYNFLLYCLEITGA